MPRPSSPLVDRLNTIGSEVLDIDEETYDVFSHERPQGNLGMIDHRSNTLQLEVAGDQYDIRQSPGLLTSSNTEGTTGAALWKISPLLAEWLADKTNVLWSTQFLRPNANVLELGCGVTGLIGCVLGKCVASYILTDQRSVLKLLQENVDTNASPIPVRVKGRSSRKATAIPNTRSNVSVLELNWETDDVQVLGQVLSPDEAVDLVIVCDCVFNDFLLEPLTSMCESIGKRFADTPTVFLFAQQLRSDQVFSAFLEILHRKFHVWRLTDPVLPSTLQNGSGFVLHVAVLR